MRLFPAGYAISLRRELRRISAAQAIPVIVQLQLTYRCNLRCPTCPFPRHDDRPPELTFDEIDGVLAQLRRLGTLYLLLSGGEIMTRHDFWAIARRAKEDGFLLILCTNGSLIGPKEADQIREIPPLNVEVNLLGKSAALHDVATGVPGSFRQTLSAVKELSERGISVLVRTSPGLNNYPQANHGANLFNGLGASSFSGESASREVGRMADRRRRLSRSLPLVRRRSDASCQAGAPEMAEVVNGQPTCIAGTALASISPLGDVRSCGLLPLDLGSLRESTFREIWRCARRVPLPAGEVPESSCPTSALQPALFLPCSTWPCSILGNRDGLQPARPPETPTPGNRSRRPFPCP